jgi:ACR3 family arsenite transporter
MLLMSQTVCEPVATGSGLGTFERYLSLWVALCMGAGIALGKLAPAAMTGLRDLQFGRGSQINAPIAVLIW